MGKILTLTRYESSDAGTFGVLTAGEVQLATVERPWLNNKPFKSCIPPGLYTLHDFDRSNGDRVFALSGDTVSVYKQDGAARYGILFHVANHSSQVVGCIAPGLARHGQMVVSSTLAMGELMNAAQDGDQVQISFDTYQGAGLWDNHR